jgi:prepilin-type processing-associated H-X9-DG protein
MRLDSQDDDKTDSTNTATLVGPEYAAFGSIGSYVKNPAIYRCPADKSAVTINGRVFPRVRSMAMNGYMGGSPGENHPEKVFWEFRTLSSLSVLGPSKAWVFIDEREDSINDGFFVVDAAARYAIIDYPASYHNGSGALSFADGHTEFHKWLEPTTTPVLQSGQRLASDSKPTLPNDRDMAWLVPRTTARH